MLLSRWMLRLVLVRVAPSLLVVLVLWCLVLKVGGFLVCLGRWGLLLVVGWWLVRRWWFARSHMRMFCMTMYGVCDDDLHSMAFWWIVLLWGHGWDMMDGLPSYVL